VLVLVVVGAVAYAFGVRRHAVLGRPWPRSRSLAFTLGIVVLAVATLPPLATADTTSFPVHVAQHLLLAMVGPVLLVLGAPLTLALQTAPPGPRARLRRTLHRRPLKALGHPVVATAVFAGSLWVLWCTPVLGWSVRSSAVHLAVHVHFLASGLLFAWAVLAVDTTPRRDPAPLRLLLVALVVPLHALLGLTLLAHQGPLAGYAADDLHRGAALLWIAGDLVAVAVLGVVVARWMVDEAREAAREDRRLEASEQGRRQPVEDVGLGHEAGLEAPVAHHLHQDAAPTDDDVGPRLLQPGVGEPHGP
jgi:putative copper resistance protein D